MDKLREYHEKLQDELDKAIKSNYKMKKEYATKGHTEGDGFMMWIDGKIAALRGISDFADALLDEVSAEK